MPQPMVHFAVCLEMSQLLSRPLTPEFLLGSIAPDAIHMRPGINRYDKWRTHLRSTLLREIVNEDYFEAVHCFLVQPRHNCLSNIDFIEGYAAHVLTDWIWHNAISRPFLARLPDVMMLEERNRLYSHETEQLDIELYNRLPWRRQVWRLLKQAQAYDIDELVTAEEVSRFREAKIEWYATARLVGDIQARIITHDDVMNFVPQAAQSLIERFTTWKIDAKNTSIQREFAI